MSDYLQPDASDYLLDVRKRSIVEGFIRSIDQRILPEEIITIILQNIDDNLMLNHGSYQWKIHFSNTKSNEKMQSNNFEIGKLQWYLYAKNKDDGGLSIHLRLKRFPYSWRLIVASIQVRCIETKFGEHSVVVFAREDKIRTLNDVSIKRTSNQHQLTILVTIDILRIFSAKYTPMGYVKSEDEYQLLYQVSPNLDNFIGPKKIKWRINGDLLTSMKKAEINKKFMSPIYGNSWCLIFQPKTKYGKGNLELKICTFPKNIYSLEVSVKIDCYELDFQYEESDIFEFAVDVRKMSVWNDKKYMYPFQDDGKFESFQKLEELTISATIQVHNVDTYLAWNNFAS